MSGELREIIETHQANEPFMYMLLDRMRQDCNYFLGSGSREANKETKLWSGSVEGIIEDMKALFLNFEEAERPEWIDMETIEDYERKMKGSK